MDFDADVSVMGQQVDELIKHGSVPIPTQWIEVDKNEHLWRPGGPDIAPK